MATQFKNCPACDAPLTLTATACPSCSMPVAIMNNYRLAKLKATSQDDLKTISSRAEARYEILRQLKKPLLILLVLIAIICLCIFLFSNKVIAPKPWLAYPTDPDELTKKFISLVAAGDDPSHTQAYNLISLSVRNPKNDNEDAQYRGLFRDINNYLTGEFGPDWSSRATLVHDPARFTPDRPIYLLTIETEKIHLLLDPQLPPLESKLPAPTPPHFGISEVEEFPFGEVLPGAAPIAALKSIGAGGSANDLQNIVGASASARESLMTTKRRCLPIVRNPNNPALKRCIYQLWRVRQDPTVIRRLQMITKDARYAPEYQHLAQQVLDSNVPEEELMAVGVPL